MELIRKGRQEVCSIHEFPFADKTAEYITFPKLESTELVSHLFSTRLGGVSENECSTMNFSYTRGDKKEAVDENYRRIAQILGCSHNDFVCTDQTHTTNVRKVTSADKGKGTVKARDYTDIDGLITNETGIVLATFYADCVPLYFVDISHKAIGLSHSGWRGTVNCMGKKTLAAMKQEYGTNPESVVAAIGPSICQDCYEVSGDVADSFSQNFSHASAYEKEYLAHCKLAESQHSCLVYEKENGKYQLNLWYANYMVLREAGIPASNIEITDLCTCCNPDYLFSHRASHGRRGNLGAFMMLKKEMQN